jgi:hypothetical protein
MTTSEIKYRLGEYVIIEHGGILLTWVSHTAIGAQLSGRCFIIGNILVLGPMEHEEAGFLVLEFFEQLMKLPAWVKTTYYCFASSLRKVGTGKSILSELIEHPYISKIGKTAGKTMGTGASRLGSYRITVGENSIISWQTIGELNRMLSGKCIVESGILFIGPKENESEDGQSRREFFAGQKRLRRWDRTFVWGHYGSLMTCKEVELSSYSAAPWRRENVRDTLTTNIPLSQNQKFRREEFQEFTASKSEWFKTIWHRIVEWKGWSVIAPLVLYGVLIGFRFVIFLVRKCAFLSLRIINHFRVSYKQ